MSGINTTAPTAKTDFFVKTDCFYRCLTAVIIETSAAAATFARKVTTRSSAARNFHKIKVNIRPLPETKKVTAYAMTLSSF
jgi:hypothetical protein